MARRLVWAGAADQHDTDVSTAHGSSVESLEHNRRIPYHNTAVGRSAVRRADRRQAVVSRMRDRVVGHAAGDQAAPAAQFLDAGESLARSYGCTAPAGGFSA